VVYDINTALFLTQRLTTTRPRHDASPC